MGVGFSHGGAHWSHSGFSAFRRRIAAQVGIELARMKGWGGSTSWSTVRDPIAPLLNHSDCDGDLSPDECDTVARRLRQLVYAWPFDDDREMALRLAGGMEECARRRVPLTFC